MTKPWLEKWGTPHIVSAGRERHIALVPLDDGGDSGLSLGITTETYCVTRAINAANEALPARASLAAAAPALARDAIMTEWSGWEDWVGDGGYSRCPICLGIEPVEYWANEARYENKPQGHTPTCSRDALLTAIGLPDQASRDAARAEIEAGQ